jgi:hypothetical protein
VSWFLRRRFLVLLLAMVLFLVVCPVLDQVLDLPLLYDGALTIVFVSAFAVIFRHSSLRLPALVLGIPTLVGAWTGYVLPGLPRLPFVVGFHVAAALFLMFAVGTILAVIYQQKEHITADSLSGALCGYLLLGVAFGHVYCVLETVAPGSFTGTDKFPEEVREQDRCHFLLTYFSLITLTSVGYGDITPVHGTARGLAAVEAITGQFYLAVLIAELVGKRLAQVHSPRGPGATGPDASALETPSEGRES